MEFNAIRVVIERLPDEQISETHTKSGGYEITAIDEDEKRRSFWAGALNINGYAFSTSGMSIQEHERLITVEKDEDSRYVNLGVRYV
jgi:hypothetical protein